MRCFVAIDLDSHWPAALGQLIPRSSARGDGVKWVAPNSLHITLWFLGEVDESALPALREVLRRASEATPAFELALDGVGGFPSPNDPRVLWVGVVDVARGCQLWIAAAAPLLTPLGFARESRPFHAHITLARARDPAGVAALRGAAERLVVPAIGPLTVGEVTLFESAPGKGGPRYNCLARFPLQSQPRESNAIERRG